MFIFFIMAKKRMPNSIRKYIRKEKARIRKAVLDVKEQEELINKLYEKFPKNPSLLRPGRGVRVKK